MASQSKQTTQRVRMITSVATQHLTYRTGVEYDVVPATAKEWIKKGLAVAVATTRETTRGQRVSERRAS